MMERSGTGTTRFRGAETKDGLDAARSMVGHSGDHAGAAFVSKRGKASQFKGMSSQQLFDWMYEDAGINYDVPGILYLIPPASQ